MNKQTFDKLGEKKQLKEDIEWLRLWCEDTNERTLPRVALIGDSITEQVFEVVKRELEGVAHVDYLATSYSLLSPAYVGMVEKFIEDSKYAVVCYNYGLHGYAITGEEYESAYKAMLEKLLANASVVVSLTTQVLENGQSGESSEVWKDKVIERNLCVEKLAKEFNLPVDDLYSISVKLASENGYIEDGVHFNKTGCEELGKSKANAIKQILAVNNIGETR